jgi:hypothetical protein
MSRECPDVERVDRHFSRRLPPAEEKAMREHMPACAACRERYERHLLLERLDPGSGDGKARIASGLGFGGSPDLRPARVFRLAGPAAGAALVAAALMLFVGRRSGNDEAEFVARGGDAEVDQSTGITVYAAHDRDGGAARAASTLRPSDDLAFEYENRTGKPWLMIFGVDEHRHVYWYYPAWMDPADDPRSIAIHRTTGREPLPDAVRQVVDGAELDIRAVFSDEPLSVKTVERAVAAAKAGAPKYVTASGTVERSIRFRIVRDGQ